MAYRVLQEWHTSVINQMNQQEQTLQDQNAALARAQLEANRVGNQQLEDVTQEPEDLHKQKDRPRAGELHS